MNPARRSWASRVLPAGLALVALLARPAWPQAFHALLAGSTLTRLQVSNAAVIGNNFTTRDPSFEYPYTAGYEHLTHAGLWVGALASDGNGPFTGVVTGAFDQSIGVSPASLTEFTPLTSPMVRRSNLPTSPVYDPAALAEDETEAVFDDHVVKTVSGASEPHRPMGVIVRQVTEAWWKRDYDDFVIVRHVIRATQPLTGVWVGLYAELASGPKNNFATWPPGGGWFYHKLLGWDAGQRLLREHYCQAPPVPTNCWFSVVPPWVGVQLLTPPAPGQAVTLAAWNFAPGSALRDQDTERYALMSAGTVTDLSAPDLQPRDGDPVELLALGPFTLAAPGDSIEVAFAFVGGADLASLAQNATAAQAVHDLGYRPGMLGAPPPPPGTGLSLAAAPPAGDGPSVRFSLPSAGRVRLELFDVGGRRLAARELGELPAGTHEAPLGGAGALAPGVYLARLTHPSGTAAARVVWLR